MPQIVQHGVRGELPPLVNPRISRDFVYSDDVVDAFVAAASELREDDYGDSFNVGTGRQTTIGELAEIARELYGIETPGELHDAGAPLGHGRLVRQQRARAQRARLGGAARRSRTASSA